LAIDSEGNIFVADMYNHRVQKFDAQGKFLTTWGTYHPISVIKSVFNFIFSTGGEGVFNYPARIAVDGEDRVYVSDSYNNRVQVFSNQGKFLFQFGGAGLWGGKFRVSSGIAVSKQGRVFVADFYNNRIQEFSRDGCFIAKWGVKGKDPGQFDGPTDLAVDSEGRVHVVDWGNHRIQVFQPRASVKK
jgi:DNA-binding beta-propeller fold protein YncE